MRERHTVRLHDTQESQIIGLAKMNMKENEGESDVTADSCHFTSGPYHFVDAPLFRTLGRMRTPRAALLAEESAYTTERSEQ